MAARRSPTPSGRDRRASDSGAAKAPKKVMLATNRKARHSFAISQTIEAGLVLLGSEVRSLRNGRASIAEGYAQLRGQELWLLGVHIPPLPQAATFGHEPLRPRLCLLHKAELRKWHRLLEAPGTTVVPLSLYFLGSKVKVELGMATGRTKGDRRNREKEKEARREIRDASRKAR